MKLTAGGERHLTRYESDQVSSCRCLKSILSQCQQEREDKECCDNMTKSFFYLILVKCKCTTNMVSVKVSFCGLSLKTQCLSIAVIQSVSNR